MWKRCRAPSITPCLFRRAEKSCIKIQMSSNENSVIRSIYHSYKITQIEDTARRTSVRHRNYWFKHSHILKSHEWKLAIIMNKDVTIQFVLLQFLDNKEIIRQTGRTSTTSLSFLNNLIWIFLIKVSSLSFSNVFITTANDQWLLFSPLTVLKKHDVTLIDVRLCLFRLSAGLKQA